MIELPHKLVVIATLSYNTRPPTSRLKGVVVMRRLRALVLGAIASMAAATAMSQPVRAPGGQEVSVVALAQQLDTPEFWGNRAGDCALAFEKAFDTDGRFAARERLAASRTFQGCVATERLAYAAANTADPVAIDQAFRQLASQREAFQESTAAQAEFMGIQLGVGVGASFSQDEVVSEAQIAADNTIIATKTETQLPRVILESHYYGWCSSKKCNQGLRGIGPYFGIVAKSDKLISAISAGVMFGWKDSAPGNPDGFSIALGAVLDSGVKSLARGFEAGKPLPPDETAIRYEEKSRWSAIFFFTRSF